MIGDKEYPVKIVDYWTGDTIYEGPMDLESISLYVDDGDKVYMDKKTIKAYEKWERENE